MSMHVKGSKQRYLSFGFSRVFFTSDKCTYRSCLNQDLQDYQDLQDKSLHFHHAAAEVS